MVQVSVCVFVNSGQDGSQYGERYSFLQTVNIDKENI